MGIKSSPRCAFAQYRCGLSCSYRWCVFVVFALPDINMRINTFSLDFSEVNEKLFAFDYHSYIEKNLKLKNEEVISIGINGNKIFVKVATGELLERIFENFEGKLTYIQRDGISKNVNLFNESLKTTVKIHRIPIEISDNEIRKALNYYGKIENVMNDAWKNLPYTCYNDIKIIKMEIVKPIPSYIPIGGKYYWITYAGQMRTCRRCGSTLHEIKDCDRLLNNRLNSFAAAVSQSVRIPVDIGENKEKPPVFDVLGKITQDNTVKHQGSTNSVGRPTINDKSETDREDNSEVPKIGANSLDDKTNKCSAPGKLGDVRSTYSEPPTPTSSIQTEIQADLMEVDTENRKRTLKHSLTQYSTSGDDSDTLKPLTKKPSTHVSWATEMEELDGCSSITYHGSSSSAEDV